MRKYRVMPTAEKRAELQALLSRGKARVDGHFTTADAGIKHRSPYPSLQP